VAGPCGICTRFPILLLQPQQAPETQIKEPMRSQTTIVLPVLSSEVCAVTSCYSKRTVVWQVCRNITHQRTSMPDAMRH